MAVPGRPVSSPEAAMLAPFRQEQDVPLASGIADSGSVSGTETRRSLSMTPSTKVSNGSSSTSDPYMHLVDDLAEKGSDYSFKGTEEEEDSSSSSGPEESYEAASIAASRKPGIARESSNDHDPGSESGSSDEREASRRKQMDRVDSALSYRETQQRRGFSAWRQARRKRKEKAAAVSSAVIGSAEAAPDPPSQPQSIYTALAAAPISPFDAPAQAIGSRSRSVQPLKSRLDSALEFAGQGSIRVSRSELLLSALPAIASSGSSSQPEVSKRAESGAGSSRSVALSPSPSLGLSLSLPMLESVSEVVISSAGTTTSPFVQQLPRAHSTELLVTAPSGEVDHINVLATLCQSVQSLVQKSFVGVLLLEDEDISASLRFSFDGQDPQESPIDACFNGWLLEPQIPAMFVAEDTLEQPRFQDHPAVVGPHGIRFYAAVALVVGSGLRLGSLYIGDRLPQQLEKESVLALQNFAKAITRRLEKMGVADEAFEQRREAVRALKAETKHPLMLVDTATANWQVLHVSEAARERIKCLPADCPLGGLWDHIAVQSEKQEGSSTGGAPRGLGEKVMHGKEFALDVRQRNVPGSAALTLRFRPSKTGEISGHSAFQPIYIATVQNEQQPLEIVRRLTTGEGTAEEDATRQKCCGVGCLVF